MNVTIRTFLVSLHNLFTYNYHFGTYNAHLHASEVDTFVSTSSIMHMLDANMYSLRLFPHYAVS